MDTHTALVQHLYTRLQSTLQNNSIEIDGGSLDIPSVVAVSWFVRQTADRYNQLQTNPKPLQSRHCSNNQYKSWFYPAYRR